jgi:hypothetical protein
MGLIEIDFSPPTVDLPIHVALYLRQMAPQVERYRSKTVGGFRGFVPSDYVAFYSALSHVVDQRLACGNAFCEWGSGLGVSTCLAGMLGFDAAGIEVDGRLVPAAVQLAEEYRCNAEFAHGSFLPAGVEDLIDSAFAENEGEISMVIDCEHAYDQLGKDLEDFDVVFCYPWPNDEGVTARVFDRCASVGAILLTFDEYEGYRARRKSEKGSESQKRGQEPNW